MTTLQTNIVLHRRSRAQWDRESRDQHGTGPHADFHDRRAAFWEAAAQAAANGDLTPVAYVDDYTNTPT